MRRPSNDRPDEIAYADVSIALLGPIMFFMLIFAVASGPDADTLGCKALDDEVQTEFNDRVAQLRQMANRPDLEMLCPGISESAGPAAQSLGLSIYESICENDRSDALEGANVTSDELARLVSGVVPDIDVMRECLAAVPPEPASGPGDETMSCLNPSDGAFDRAVAAVSDWREGIEELEARVGERCEPLPEGAARTAVAETPDALVALCPEARDRVLQAAGVANLADLQARASAAQARSLACIGPQCPELSNFERGTLIMELRDFSNDLVDKQEALEESLNELDCAPTPDTELREWLERGAFLPEKFEALCPHQRDEIAREALDNPLGLAELQRRIVDFTETVEDLALCQRARIDDEGSERGTEPETAAVGAGEPAHGAGAHDEADVGDLPSLEPESGDAEDVANQASDDPGQAEEAGAESGANEARRVEDGPDVVRDIVHQVAEVETYDDCELEPSEGNAGYRGIDDLVASVREALNNPDVNRIDIVGFADAQTVLEGCQMKMACFLNLRKPPGPNADRDGHARRHEDICEESDGLVDLDNTFLSTLRAASLKRRLVEALEDEDDIAKLLEEREVRVYAIGAGIDTPLFNNPEGDSDDPTKRKVAIRVMQALQAEPHREPQREAER